MIEMLLLRIRRRYALTGEEENALLGAMTETRAFRRGDIITPEDQPVGFSSMLLDGFACRSKYLPDGERQIMEISLPGDFVDLHSYPLERLDHSVTALSACTLVRLPHREITGIISARPRLGRVLWFLTMVDASIHREWLVCLGKRNALESLAHLFCEIFHRLRAVELTDGLSYRFPISQVELGEVLGLSSVHINRTMKQLRETGAISFQGGFVTIKDQARLEEMADFDPRYLYLEPRGQ